MYGNGVDVILHGAGASGAGVFAAALEARSGGGTAWAIGVDFDQAAGAEADVAAVILTSAFRTLDGVVFWAAEQYAAGNLAGGEADLGIAEGAVGLATTGGFLEAILADLESYADLIADGTIVVPEQP
jgi:basic membrane protein A